MNLDECFKGIVVRNTFLDVDDTLFREEHCRTQRRARSAPPRISLSVKPDMIPVTWPTFNLDTWDNAIATVHAMNASLDSVIEETRSTKLICVRLLDLSSNYRKRRLTSRTRSLFFALQKAYQLNYTSVVLKMLYGVFFIAEERIHRFFSDLRRRDIGCNDFHLQFVLDAHAPHGIKHYLLFSRQNGGSIQCLTMWGGPRDLSPAEAIRLYHNSSVICMKKRRRYVLCTLKEGLDSLSLQEDYFFRL